MTPISALPEKLRDIDKAWAGTDNASWLMRMKKRIQYWFAAGPRVPSGFWKWRELPIVLFKTKGEGNWRFENTDGSRITAHSYAGSYLSRIQPWCQWHVSFHWPFFFNFHFIYKFEDVAIYPEYKSDFGIDKMFTFYIGWKRDSDKVYWPTAFIGGNFE